MPVPGEANEFGKMSSFYRNVTVRSWPEIPPWAYLNMKLFWSTEVVGRTEKLETAPAGVAQWIERWPVN